MATFVHRRNTPAGPRYRVWNTVVDAYETAPLTREETLAYLRERDRVAAAEATEQRIARADTHGTSSRLGDTRDPHGPWDTERCEDWPGGGKGCGRFHHAFVASERHTHDCKWCGEPESERHHGPPCFERETYDDGLVVVIAPAEEVLVRVIGAAAASANYPCPRCGATIEDTGHMHHLCVCGETIAAGDLLAPDDDVIARACAAERARIVALLEARAVESDETAERYSREIDYAGQIAPDRSTQIAMMRANIHRACAAALREMVAEIEGGQ